MKSATILNLGGASREVDFISSAGAGNQIVIELEDGRRLSQIAEEFENAGKITCIRTDRPEIETTYSGYTELIDIRRNQVSGGVRLTLKKP